MTDQPSNETAVERDFERVKVIFEALGSKTRLQILYRLKSDSEGVMTVKDIATSVNCSIPTALGHIKKLHEAKLIEVEKRPIQGRDVNHWRLFTKLLEMDGLIQVEVDLFAQLEEQFRKPTDLLLSILPYAFRQYQNQLSKDDIASWFTKNSNILEVAISKSESRKNALDSSIWIKKTFKSPNEWYPVLLDYFWGKLVVQDSSSNGTVRSYLLSQLFMLWHVTPDFAMEIYRELEARSWVRIVTRFQNATGKNDALISAVNPR